MDDSSLRAWASQGRAPWRAAKRAALGPLLELPRPEGKLAAMDLRLRVATSSRYHVVELRLRMSFVDQFKRFLGMSPPEPADTELIYIHLPEALEPEERELRYGEPIDAELKLRALG